MKYDEEQSYYERKVRDFNLLARQLVAEGWTSRKAIREHCIDVLNLPANFNIAPLDFSRIMNSSR